MPTLADLGQAYKAKYPGKYDSFSDYDMGNAVKQKYPGKYDSFLDAPGPAKPPVPLGLQPQSAGNTVQTVTNQPWQATPGQNLSFTAGLPDAMLNMAGKGNSTMTRLGGVAQAAAPVAAAIGPGAFMRGGAAAGAVSGIGRGTQAVGAGTKAAVENLPLIGKPLSAGLKAAGESLAAPSPTVPPPTVQRPAPIWQAQPPQAPPPAAPSGPLSTPPTVPSPQVAPQLPSGRQVGPAPQAATAPPPQRQPAWQNLPTVPQNDLPQVSPIRAPIGARRVLPSQVPPPVAQAAPAAQPQPTPQAQPAPAPESAPQGGTPLKPGEIAISPEQVGVKKGGLGEAVQVTHDDRLDSMRPHFEKALEDPSIQAAIEAGDPNWNPNPPGKIGSNITNNWDGLRKAAGLKWPSRIKKPDAPMNTPERLLDEKGIAWGSKPPQAQAAAVGGPPTMPQPVQQQQAGPAAVRMSPPNVIRMVANAVPKEGIGISELRENLPQLSKQELDQAVMDLYRSNKIDLDAHDFPQGETPEDLARLTVPDGKGNYYIMAGRK